jgi:protein-L-isoaspartate(D-aspartate) O-methyltransferase
MQNTDTELRARLVHRLASQRLFGAEVLAALGRVPRHEFVPEAERWRAYENRPLGIGHGQTISQPLVVALMTDLAEVTEGARVLEIGTGSGYQTAVLAALGAEIFSVEILEPLARSARAILEKLGLGVRVHFRVGDGSVGWPEAAPFDAILATAAPAAIPEALPQQLALGGRLVIPVGKDDQQLYVIRRSASGFDERIITPVSFVPMTGSSAVHSP